MVDPGSTSDSSVERVELGLLKRCLLYLTNGAGFHVLFCILMSTEAFIALPIIQGLQFDELIPDAFRCRAAGDSTEWFKCDKEFICDRKLEKNLFTPVRSDPAYFENWVEHFSLLCEPEYRIAMLGSLNFVGVLLTVLPVPYIADKHGRKKVLVSTMIINILALGAIYFTSNLNFAYFLIIVNGMCFAGRVVAGMNLIVEFMHSQEWKNNTVNYFNFIEPFYGMLALFYYAMISHQAVYLHYFFVVVATINLVFVTMYVPESPKFLYTKGRLQEARESILAAA